MSKQRVYVGRGLTHKTALKRAREKCPTIAINGVRYDATTGWAELA